MRSKLLGWGRETFLRGYGLCKQKIEGGWTPSPVRWPNNPLVWFYLTLSASTSALRSSLKSPSWRDTALSSKKDLKDFDSRELLLVKGAASRGVSIKIRQIRGNHMTLLSSLASALSRPDWVHLVHVPSLQLGVEVRKVGVGRELRKPVKARRSATLPGRSATFAFYPQLPPICNSTSISTELMHSLWI